MDVLKSVWDSGLIPVVVITDKENAVPAAKALLAGDVHIMEITFRTGAAAESIKAVTDMCPGMCVGAGTVINLGQCKEAVASGAKFIVTPGYSEEVVDWCISRQIPVIPGCVTPTEIMRAVNKGINIVKFFPMGVYGGVGAMKALAGPFPSVRFIPTGGVDADSFGEILSKPFIYAVGGSWVCTKQDIEQGNYDKITVLCREARETVVKARKTE